MTISPTGYIFRIISFILFWIFRDCFFKVYRLLGEVADGRSEVKDVYYESETIFITDSKEAIKIHKAYTRGCLREAGMIWGRKILRIEMDHSS